MGSIASSHGEAASAAGPMDINTEVPPAPKEASSAPAPSSSTGEPASQPGPSGSLGAAFLADSSGSRKRTLEQEKEYLTKRLKQLEDEEKGVVEQKLANALSKAVKDGRMGSAPATPHLAPCTWTQESIIVV